MQRAKGKIEIFTHIYKLGYLKGRIAADILSICLLPIMVFYRICRFSQKYKCSQPPQQELCELFVVIRPDYKHRCYSNVIATTCELYSGAAITYIDSKLDQ